MVYNEFGARQKGQKERSKKETNVRYKGIFKVNQMNKKSAFVFVQKIVIKKKKKFKLNKKDN